MKLLRLAALLPGALVVFIPPARGDAPERVEVAATPALAVEIVPRPEKEAFDNQVEVRFKNLSPRPLRLLLPYDTGDLSWRMPCYRLTIRDDRGRPLDIGLGSMLADVHRDPKGPVLLPIEIRPGRTFTMQFFVPQAVPAEGHYLAVFEYNFHTLVARVVGWKCPPGVWEGTVRSREVALHLRTQP